ncbi:hypothetical protein KA005_22365 [bacterium]|nr:hypothetical protein [bacterium]
MGVKISELTAAGELDGTEVFPIVQSGSTVKTNIEAGMELSFDDDTINPFMVKKLSNDVVFASIYWPEIPKQGTGLTITFPSTSFVIYDGSGTSINLSSATTSNFNIVGKIVSIRIISVGAFTTLNSGPLVVEVNGSGGKLTIT